MTGGDLIISFGVLVAMQKEIEFVLNSMYIKKEVMLSNTKFYVGDFFEKEIIVSICGVGKVNAAVATQNLISYFKPDFIINMGLAGCAFYKISVEDVVVANHVVQYDVDTTALGDPLGMVSTVNIINFPCSEKLIENFFKGVGNSNAGRVFLGTVASGDKFLKEKSEIVKVNEYFNALAIDMEAGSIAQVCYLNNVEFCCLKVISDSVFDLKNKNIVNTYNKSKKNFPTLFLKLLHSIL